MVIEKETLAALKHTYNILNTCLPSPSSFTSRFKSQLVSSLLSSLLYPSIFAKSSLKLPSISCLIFLLALLHLWMLTNTLHSLTYGPFPVFTVSVLVVKISSIEKLSFPWRLRQKWINYRNYIIPYIYNTSFYNVKHNNNDSKFTYNYKNTAVALWN